MHRVAGMNAEVLEWRPFLIKYELIVASINHSQRHSEARLASQFCKKHQEEKKKDKGGKDKRQPKCRKYKIDPHISLAGLSVALT